MTDTLKSEMTDDKAGISNAKQKADVCQFAQVTPPDTWNSKAF